MTSPSPTAAEPTTPEPLVVLRGVVKGYTEGGRRHRVLDGVDLEVAAGERLVLLGRSGSGKSTLLNLLGGLDLADAGTVRVAGRDLAALSETARTLLRRHRIGFVFQLFNLVPTLTVGENVALPLELRGVGAGEDRDARVRHLLAAVGLLARRDAYPDVLSGGEQQRVAIARALAHEPDLLLADEPTGNLDGETAEAVLALLAESVAAAGATLVMATHSREAASRLGDRVLRVEGGRLVPP